MKNIALIYFEEKEIKGKFLFNIIQKLKLLFSFKVKPASIDKVLFESNLTMYMIKLPYTLKALNKAGKFTRNRINRCLSQLCTDNSIDTCIFPGSLTCSLDIGIKSNRLIEKFVFKVLAADIVRYISASQDLSIRDMDIAIIQGDNGVLPYMVIKELSPDVKFITLVTNNRDQVESNIEEVCYETGLSVRITKDAESVLNNSDIVINYGNLKSYHILKNIDSNAIIINYGQLREDKFKSDNEIICGIDIGLADRYKESVKEDVLSFYSISELAHIVLASKSEITMDISEEFTDYNYGDKIVKVFSEDGFYIKGIHKDRIFSKNNI